MTREMLSTGSAEWRSGPPSRESSQVGSRSSGSASLWTWRMWTGMATTTSSYPPHIRRLTLAGSSRCIEEAPKGSPQPPVGRCGVQRPPKRPTSASTWSRQTSQVMVAVKSSSLARGAGLDSGGTLTCGPTKGSRRRPPRWPQTWRPPVQPGGWRLQAFRRRLPDSRRDTERFGPRSTSRTTDFQISFSLSAGSRGPQATRSGATLSWLSIQDRKYRAPFGRSSGRTNFGSGCRSRWSDPSTSSASTGPPGA